MTRTLHKVTARPWSGGWELHIEGLGATQSATLDDAEFMVRDYISLDLNVPANSFDVQITPVLGGEKLGNDAARDLVGVEKTAVTVGRTGLGALVDAVLRLVESWFSSRSQSQSQSHSRQ